MYQAANEYRDRISPGVRSVSYTHLDVYKRQALHSAVNKIDKRSTIFMKSSLVCECADNIAIVARNVDSLKNMYALMKAE